MESDTLYKYIGLTVVMLAFVYIVLRTFNFQTNVLKTLGQEPVMEGFSDSTINTVKQNTTVIDDALLVSKYRKQYQNLLVDLEDNARAYVLAGVLNNAEKISADPGDSEMQTLLKKINTVNDFRRTLEDAMQILNKHA
jgi:hypothetical protein